EEKLKLQYIKKKALREQWLMDGLSQQSEEEQAAMRLQAQDEQQQSDQLQSNILRIEKELEALETQELNISANEEVVLKRLKEVERTTEDIIKVGSNINFSSFIPFIPTKSSPIPETGSEEPKKATFAMEISVEHDKRTGKSQVVSTATITPEAIQERGLKVYDDGRKSVYALHPDGRKKLNGAVGEMTSSEVEELLHQATDKNVPTDVQYHKPVYSVPYSGNSRPSTPRTPSKAQRLTPSPNCSPFNSSISSRNETRIFREENERGKDLEGWRTPNKTTSPSIMKQDCTSKDLTRSEEESEADPDALRESPGDFNRYSPFSAESFPSRNLVNNLPEEVESEPITMIFMGYENADGEEEDDIQAELVIIGNSDEDDDEENKYVKNENEEEDCLSYHPEGYKSKVFQPEVGMAKVTDCRHTIESTYTNTDDSGLHKPTFMHKPGKHSQYLQGQGVDGSANTDSINMEKMKLCSTGR
uniref:Palmdelphin n=1 Tax=Labrus bergylta TaxID=56723 RepID=A0A3Q3GIT3_9LABR